MAKIRKIWRYCILPGLVLVGIGILIVGTLFCLGRSATQNEWKEKVNQRRTPSEMKGLLDSMADFRSDVPNFLPQSSLDDEMCAASINNVVNFIVGEDVLRSVPAWEYFEANKDNLEKVYDRQDDFQIIDGKIVEVDDRGFNLTQLLDPAGIYILAYHYRHTRMDAKIVASKSDINSHLMLLLPKKDGRWWGYHLVHYPSDTWMDNPAKIEPVDVLDNEAGLDLTHIMRVKGVDLPSSGEDLFLLNYGLHYSQMRPWLNWFEGYLEFVIDTVAVYVLNLFNNTQQFPIIVNLNHQDVMGVPYNGKLFHGKILGFYQKNPIYYHDPKNRGSRSLYGQRFQCVEFVNRVLASWGHKNLTRTGHADSYYWQAQSKGLQSFQNGGTEKPKINDILVFDGNDQDGNPGHVAVVYSVTDTYVCFVQQNVGDLWHDCLPIKNSNGHWLIEGEYAPVKLPVIGWSREKGD